MKEKILSKFYTRKIDFEGSSLYEIEISSLPYDGYVNKIKFKSGNKKIEIYKGSGQLYSEKADMLCCEVKEEERESIISGWKKIRVLECE